MTVPYYCLLLAGVCVALRALFGLLALIDAAAKVGAGRAQTPPGDLATTAAGAGIYDQERDA